MGKKATEELENQEVIEQPAEQPAEVPTDSSTLLAELGKKGSVTLKAKTKEQLQEDALALIEASEGKAYANGAASYESDIDMYIINILRKED